MAIVTLPGGWVDVRAITGHDENRIAQGDSSGSLIGALTLIDCLMVERPGAVAGPGDAADLTSATRDRLLCAIYDQIYGDLVVSSPKCGQCAHPFDLSFSLQRVLEDFPMAPLPADGVYESPAGVPFRLPTGRDELAILGLPAAGARATLLNACLSVRGAQGHTQSLSAAECEAIEAAMEAVAPLINLELIAECPDCGFRQKIRFDIGAYLLGRLRADHARLASDVHVLALTYHWGLNEILSLSRAERGRYRMLIEADANRARLRATSGGRTRSRIG